MNFFSVLQQIEVSGVQICQIRWVAKQFETVNSGGGACDDVWAGDDMAQRVATFILSSLLVLLDIF